jgi:hypothetical protein
MMKIQITLWICKRVNPGMTSVQGMAKALRAPGAGRRVYLLPANLESRPWRKGSSKHMSPTPALEVAELEVI